MDRGRTREPGRWTYRSAATVAIAAILAAAAALPASAGTTPPDTGTEQAAGAESPTDADWDAIVAQAKEEGFVRWYVAPAGIHEAIVAAFNEHYPEIEVEVLREPGGDLAVKLENERDTGADGGDVFWNAEISYCMKWAEEGTLATPVGPQMEHWRGTEYDFGTWINPHLIVYVLAWNTDLVDDPPSSYRDLLDPRFEGQIASSPIDAFTNGSFYIWLEEEFGEDYLPALAEQDLIFYASSAARMEALVVGEAAVSMVATGPQVQERANAGAPVDWTVPDEAMGLDGCLAIPAWSHRPAAAQVLADFLLSEEVAQILHEVEFASGASPVWEIPGELQASSLSAVLNHINYPFDQLEEFTPYWFELFRGE